MTAINNTAPTFSLSDGKVTTDFGGDSAVRGVFVQADGKILAAGYANNSIADNFALARYNSDGGLDTGFGTGGKVITTLFSSNGDYGMSVTTQSDGKILVAGSAHNSSSYDFALVRYNSNGSLDTTFDGDGKLTTDFGGSGDCGYSVTTQSDGKILVAGYLFNESVVDFALARYNGDGTLDSSFDSDGKLATDFDGYGDFGTSLTTQSDGKILVAGYVHNSEVTDFALARYNSDGSLDSTFSGDGKVITDFGGDDCGSSVTMQSDGKIIIAGFTYNYKSGSGHDFALVRYNSDGSLDTGFGTGGKVTTDFGSSTDVGASVIVQSDGKIVVAGSSYSNGARDDMALVRYNADGTLDTSFDVDGKLTTDFNGNDDAAESVAVQSDGRIIVAGLSYNDFALARYNADGSLDTSFGANNTLNVTQVFNEFGVPVVLDSNAQIYDAELASSGNYGGATLTLLRHGGASMADLFSNTGTLAALTAGSDLVVNGTAIGTIITNSGGTLAVTFNGSATQELVNSLLQQIAYSNTSHPPQASVEIDWIFSDGNIGNQGLGGSLNVTGSTTAQIIPDSADSLSNNVLSFDIGVPSQVLAATGQITVMAASRYGYLTTVTLDVSQLTLIGLHLTIPMSGTDAYGETYWLDPYSGGKLFVEIPANLVVGQDARTHVWEVGNISDTSYLLTPMTIVTGGAGTIGADWITGTNGNDAIHAGSGDDFIEWRGGNDVLDAGEGHDTVYLSTNIMNYSYQVDAEGVLHIGSYSYSQASLILVDAYRIIKLAGNSFRIDKMHADGATVDSTMALSNTERVMMDSDSGFNLMPGTLNGESGNMEGTPWDDVISLDAANLGSLMIEWVWGDTGNDTIVLDFGAGYSKLELVRNGTAYLLQGTVEATGTVVDLGQAEFYPDDTTITIGVGTGATSFFSYSIEAFHFVSGTTRYDVDPAQFVEVFYQSGSSQNWIVGTVKDDTIDADALGLANHASTTNDYIRGNGGNDTIDGGSGNDTVDGGDGNDTVVFSGNFADYTIAHDMVLSRYTITDHVAGRDGTDVVTSVENFRFADGFLPTLSAFNGAVAVTSEDSGNIEVTFADLLAQGNEADVDGTVESFVVKSVSNGTLRIGSDAASAAPYNGWINNTIDAAHKAYWTPAANLNGTLNAFAVVAKDDTGLESFIPVQATVTVAPVSDAPIIFQPSVLSFAERINYATGLAPYFVITEDVNGDGKSDLIVANLSSNSVSVLKNNGDGTFAAKVDYATGSTPYLVISADVNGDGKADLITVNRSSNSVSVLKNNGGGTFAPKVDYATGSSTFSVTSADVNGDSKIDLIVANFDDNNVSVLKNNGDGTFAARVNYEAGSTPYSVTSADVNGDDKIDLVVTNLYSNCVSILDNNGDGTFAAKVDYATGSLPYFVTSADVNGDGKVDLIVSNSGSDSVSVLKNNGDGTFAAKVDYATGGTPHILKSADINGDGKSDLIIAISGSNNISLLTNNGDGTFGNAHTYSTGSGAAAYSITCADINGDGKNDLIVPNYYSSTLSVLTNTSHPAVTSFIEGTPVHISRDIIINDPDGDASWNGGALKVQITFNAEAADSLTIASGNPGGNGIWLDVAAGNSLMAGTTVIGTASAATVSNGDAWNFSFNASATNTLVQEVARALIFSNSSYTPGTADRSITFTVTDNTLISASLVETVTVTDVDFAPTLTAFSGAVAVTSEDSEDIEDIEVTFADLLAKGNEADVDGTVESFVVKSVSNGTLRIGSDAASATPYNGWINNTIDALHHAYWSPDANLNGTLNAFAVVAKDNTGEESSTPVQATVTVSPINDAPVIFQPIALSFADKVDYAIGNSPYLVTSADINGDGKADLIVANNGSSTVSVLKNNGDGTFAAKVDYATGSAPYSVTSADVNGDSKIDLIVANYGDNTVSVLKNNGDGTFAAKVDYTAGSFSYFVTSADVNGDSKIDLIVANLDSNSVSVLQNSGDGTFAAKVDYATGSYPCSVTSADVNGDGKGDLIVANCGGNSVSVLHNNGDGTFAAKVDYSTGSWPFSVTSVDVNGDGKSDLIVANKLSQSVSVLKNNGDGTFTAKVDYSTGSYPSSVTSADVNGDGRVDLIVANWDSQTVSVLQNNGNGTFAAKVDYSTGSQPLSVTSADLNGDGKSDLIVANSQSNSVSVLTNTSHPAVTSFIEGIPVHISSDIIINDPDGDAGWSGGALKVQITFNAEAADSLIIATDNPGGNAIWLDVAAGNSLMAGTTVIGTASAATVSNGVAWNFSFNASATNTLVQEVARTLIFSNSSSTPGTADRSITVTVTDNTLISASVVESLAISPMLSSSTPSDNALTVAIDCNIVLTFNKPVHGGIGAIVLADDSGDIRTIDVTDSSQVIFSGSTLTINPTDDLRADSVYNVQMASGVITDLTGNVYVGIGDATSLDFVTAANTVVSNGQKLYNYNGHTYQLTSGLMSWEQAESEAVAHGGHLVSINSSEENQWLFSAFAGNKAWIGLNDIQQEGVWRWTDRSLLTYTNWSSGEPNNSNGSEDASEIYCDNTGRWNDWVGTNRQYGIIEYTSLITINPTLTAFSGLFGTTTEDAGDFEVTYAALQAQGNEADADGTVEAFVVKSISGTLSIGTDAASATAWDASTNNIIDATHQAYWRPAANANGTLNAFTVVARDNSGGESITPVPVTFNVLNSNLHVESITAPSSAFAGREIEVQWVVNNTGNASTMARTWYDQVYLSSDTTLDGTDLLLSTVQNQSYLDIAEGYTSTARVILPKGREGNYHILVKTDVYGNIPEGGGESDNVTASNVLDIQPIPLSEFSDPAVVSVAAPLQALSGQNMTLTYTIDNAGMAPITGNATVWVERIYISSDTILDGGDRLLSTVWRDLSADKLPLPEGQSHFVTTQKVMLPVGVDGEFYFFATVTPVSPVSNAFQSNDVAYDTTPTLVRLTPPPDLEASAIAAPSPAIAGHDLSVTYQVNNIGSSATPNSGWYDSLYLSRDTALDAADTRLTEVWHAGALESGGNYSNTVTVRLPEGVEGSWHLLSSTDSRNDVFELDNANNVCASSETITINVLPADLFVTEVSAPTAVQAGNSMRVTWTVKNQGLGYSSIEQWSDQVTLSSDAVLGNGDDVWIGNFTHTGLLQAGQTYTNSALVSLPKDLSGQYQLFVVTDADKKVYEAGQENNNARLFGVGLDGQPGLGIQVVTQPTADLQVASVTAPLSAASGDWITVSYSVVNAGLGRTTSAYWRDEVILSKDEIPGNADDVTLGSVYHANQLGTNESYQASGSFKLPIDLQGDYHVWVRTDAGGGVTEANGENNNLEVAAGTTTVNLTATPDLLMSTLQAADQGTSGQNLQLSWTVHNNGADTSGGWRQAFYLSRDGMLDRASDIYLGYAESPATLSANADVVCNHLFRIPDRISGNYYLFGIVDSNNTIYERGGEGNNTAMDATALQITLQTPADLVAGLLTLPENGIPGAQASIAYTITNQSEQAVTGQWSDSIYLSSDAVWDAGDALFARIGINEGLAGNASYTRTVTGILPGLVGGDYYVIVRSDILYQISETNEANNLKVSLDTTRMDVEALTLGAPDAASFAQGGALYYRVDVAAGETLRINFDRAATEGRTELFVSYDAMPSRSDSDYRYNQADSPDQSLVIANIRGGTYYVMAYNASGATDTCSITADTLQFSITEIGTTAGSNKGNVTVRIDGAELTTRTTAMLVGPDGAEHAASEVYWKDNTELWATFDLRGLSTDTYDVKVQDGVRTALLNDSFTVNNGDPGHVEYGIETPSALRPGQVGTVRVYYQNLGDTDVAAPLLTVSGNALLKQPGDAAFGGTSLQLLGINSDGPAGILSPGAEGSFQLFFTPAFSGWGSVQLNISSLQLDKSIDWSTYFESIKPENIDSASWVQIKANLSQQFGTTNADYQNALAQNATALDMLEGRTNDVARLFAMEYNQATNNGALYRSAEIGVLGRDHSFQWDITATPQENGDVVVDLAGIKQIFTHLADGSYQGTDGATLTQNGGAFTFFQQDGKQISFNLDGTFDSIQEANGLREEAVYTNHHVTQIISSNGDSQNFSYNEQGRLVQITNQNGESTSFTYDLSGKHQTSVTSAEGTTFYEYVTEAGAAQHQLSAITLPDGTVSHFTYDAQGRLSTESLNDGPATATYQYIGANEVDITDASGSITRIWYNERGQVAQVEDSSGNVNELHYDSNGNFIESVSSIAYSVNSNQINTLNSQFSAVPSANYSAAPIDSLAQITGESNTVTAFDGFSGIQSYGAMASAMSNSAIVNYALMAGGSYESNRPDINKFPVPEGWSDLTYTYGLDGFEAKSFIQGNEIVISYAGTNPVSEKDWLTDILLGYGYGYWPSQLVQAAKFFLQIKEAYPNADIRFTGHSLGGGLASLMGIFFNEPTVTFDQAPFLNSANTINAIFLNDQLQNEFSANSLDSLNRFIFSFSDPNSVDNLEVRKGNVYNIDVEGEFLTVLVKIINALEGINTVIEVIDQVESILSGDFLVDFAIDQIINSLTDFNPVDLKGNLLKIDRIGTDQILSHGSADLLMTFDLHSPALLAAFLQNDLFRTVTFKLPEVISLIFNDAMYPKDASSSIENFLEHIIRHEFGNAPGVTASDNMLTRFTDDLWAIAQDGGLSMEKYGLLADNPLGKTLIAFAMQKYYDEKPAESNTELFTKLSGCLEFDFREISGSIANVTKAKGYDLFFKDFLNVYFSPEDRALISGILPDLQNWYIQAGSYAMNAIDIYNKGAFMLGYSGSDNITGGNGSDVLDGGDGTDILIGGDGNDVLIGGNGDDTLFGGMSNDILKGGAGYDTYYANGSDYIDDNDGKGIVFYDDIHQLTGGWRKPGEHLFVGSNGVVYEEPYEGTIIAYTPTGKLTITAPASHSTSAYGQTTYSGMFDMGIILVTSNTKPPPFPPPPPGGGWEWLFNLFRPFIPIIRPSDPNDIVGPQGFGEEHWTSSQNALPYTIHYENQASATAPAQEVTITQTLDSDLNAGSFRLGDFGWSDIYIDVPDGISFYIDRIDLTATKGYMVDVMAGIDVAKHEAYWSFTTIDPNTGEIPVDPTIGFLPPDSDGSIGQGFVNYTVRANAGVLTGTVIDAKATIVFTTQEPIDTPAISNTLDTQAPDSHIEAGTGTTVETAQFLVRWSGSDVGSAIAGYTVYVADNGGAYMPWLENTTLTEASYAGQPGHTYDFYSVATDNAGNKEGSPGQADLSVEVAAAAALTDTVPPEIVAVALSTDGLYAAGHALDFTIRFSESLFVDIAALPPAITMIIGGSAIEAVYQSGSGTDTLIFRHIIADGESSSDGLAFETTLMLNGATLRDVAGNPLVDLSLAGSISINNSPVVQTPLADQSATESQHFSFLVPLDAFTDVDAGDTLSYSATLGNGNPLPGWLSFDNSTRIFSGTASNGDEGQISVRVTVADSSSATASDIFDLTVSGGAFSVYDLHGGVTFWKTGEALAGVISNMGSDSSTTASDGLYQHLDMADGSYALTSAKVSGIAETTAIKANDALEALKIAVGMNPNADGSAVSPYQYLAADVNHDGQIKAADALNILKMAVKLDTAPAKEWLFVTESVGSESMSRTNVVWPDNPISVTLDMDQELNLIGIVKGDVNGSWVA